MSKTLRIASLNVQGALQAKAPHIIHLFNKLKLDILLLVVTQATDAVWQHSFPTPFQTIRNTPESNCRSRSIGFLFQSHMYPFIHYESCISSPRYKSIIVNLHAPKLGNTYLVGVHRPNEDQAGNIFFENKILGIAPDLLKKGKIIMLGDFNAITHKQDSSNPNRKPSKALKLCIKDLQWLTPIDSSTHRKQPSPGAGQKHQTA